MAIKKYGDWRDGGSFPAFLWAIVATPAGTLSIVMAIVLAIMIWGKR